jgi:hypothetical protein
MRGDLHADDSHLGGLESSPRYVFEVGNVQFLAWIGGLINGARVVFVSGLKIKEYL